MPRFIVDGSEATVTLPRGASDAALAPYHVDRSKLFAMDRLAGSPLLDAERVARAVEFTRFPSCPPSEDAPEDQEGRLVQATDLIGQLRDPLHLKKANALYCEFEEIDQIRRLGYASPVDLVERFPDFYWTSVSPHLEEAIGYLNVTAAGRQWIANLHSHVFCAEHAFALMGPQRQSADRAGSPHSVVSPASPSRSSPSHEGPLTPLMRKSGSGPPYAKSGHRPAASTPFHLSRSHPASLYKKSTTGLNAT
jgi:hypothetical protein